jgi:tetratricopeptide (TPR) repeat protein
VRDAPRTTTPRDPVREIVRKPGTRDEEVDLSRTATRRDPEPPSRPARPPATRDEDTGRVRKATPARGTSFSTPSHGVKIIAHDDEAKYRAGQAAERARRLIEAHEYAEATKEALAATRLAPDSFDYQALHAWATFCGARDKTAVADATRKLLEKATHRAAQPNDVRMMLGKLERVAGREREALRHFKAVLERDPQHAEATTLIRELEAQLEAFARR